MVPRGPSTLQIALKPTRSTATVALTRSGGDALRLGGGQDVGHGGYGDDFIGAVDKSKDDISCGPGSDRARANPGDDIEDGCEKVIRDGVRVD